MKNRTYLTIFLSISVFIIIWILSVPGNMFYHFNKDFQSLITSYFDKSHVSKDIVVVGIDEKTLAKLGRFPFDRKEYIPIIERLNEQGVALIAFDIIFADKSNPDSDKAFSDAIKAAKNIIIGMSFSSQGYLELPLELFYKHIVATGFYSPYIDPITKSVYSYKPYYQDKKTGKLYEHFSIVIAKQFLGIEGISTIKNDRYYLDSTVSLPFAQKNTPLVYVNNKGSEQYSYISFYDIYDENEFERIKQQIDLKDKIILIGATAKGIKDTFNTSQGIIYGVHFHANALNTILQNSGFRFLSEGLEWLLILLIINISIYFNLSRSGKILIASNIFLIIFFGIFFPILAYIFVNQVTNYFYELFAALLFSLASSNVFKYMIENKHKNKLNKALGEYVSKDIAAEILSGSGKINLDGENKKIAIFFSDIEGFTTISEKFTPELLVTFLREYLSHMSNIILDQRGFINKYEGDAIMALWGVFGHHVGRDCHEACESALLQQEKLKELNIKWEHEGYSHIKARIGIHVGEAIIGNIGATGRKMEFTALGDSVNLASRLEGVNKFYGTYICVSEDVVAQTKEDYSYRYLDKIRVKGKKRPIVIYELLSRKGCLDERKKQVILDYTQGIKLYLEGNFSQALEIFIKCVEQGDAPSQTYINRCKIFLEQSPADDWDGVWNHDEK